MEFDNDLCARILGKIQIREANLVGWTTALRKGAK